MIVVTKKGANTHFLGGDFMQLELFYSIVSWFSSKSYNYIFQFSLFAWAEKRLEGEIFNGSLKNHNLKW